MKALSREEMARVQGGGCEEARKVAMVSCAVASVTGLFGALILGPTCVGSAIGAVVEC